MQVIRDHDDAPLPSLGLSALHSDRAVAQINFLPIQSEDFGHSQPCKQADRKDRPRVVIGMIEQFRGFWNGQNLDFRVADFGPLDAFDRIRSRIALLCSIGEQYTQVTPPIAPRQE
jgi:hypothetical protein